MKISGIPLELTYSTPTRLELVISHQCVWRYIQSLKEWWIPPNFLIYVLVCTAQTTKSMKTNDIPFKSPIKLQQEIKKKIWNFLKFVRILGHFLNKQCFWKMGVAGIKQSPRPSKIASFFMETQWGSTPESFIQKC